MLKAVTQTKSFCVAHSVRAGHAMSLKQVHADQDAREPHAPSGALIRETALSPCGPGGNPAYQTKHTIFQKPE